MCVLRVPLDIDLLPLNYLHSGQHHEYNIIGFIKLDIPDPIEYWVIQNTHLIVKVILVVEVQLDLMYLFLICLVIDFLLDVSLVVIGFHENWGH